MKKTINKLFLMGATALFAAQVYAQPVYTALVPTSETVGQSWKYTTEEPNTDWNTLAYDDATWNVGIGAFGSLDIRTSRTEWLTPAIWTRKQFHTGNITPDQIASLKLSIFYDDDVRVYINGALAFSATGYATKYKMVDVSQEAKDAIVPNGTNVIAVYTQQFAGGQHIDVGLYRAENSVEILPTADAAQQTWKYTIDNPGDNWASTGFNDNDWYSSNSGFGGTEFPVANTNTTWTSSDIWMRKTVLFPSLTEAQLQRISLKTFYDDDVEVYINGVLAFKGFGYLTEYYYKDISTDAKNAIVNGGNNLIAVKCHQGHGGQYIDLGIYTVDTNALPLSVNNRTKAAVANVVYNAASKTLTVSDKTIARIEILNLGGANVKSVDVNGADTLSVKLDDLANGVYLVSVTANGKKTTAKIVKK